MCRWRKQRGRGPGPQGSLETACQSSTRGHQGLGARTGGCGSCRNACVLDLWPGTAGQVAEADENAAPP